MDAVYQIPNQNVITMGAKIIDYPNKPTTSIDPFEVKRMMVALELGEADQTVLKYLDFFTDGIPVDTIHFSHVLPSIDLYSPFEDEQTQLISNAELNKEVIEKMRAELQMRRLKHQTKYFSFEVRKGNPLEELHLF